MGILNLRQVSGMHLADGAAQSALCLGVCFYRAKCLSYPRVPRVQCITAHSRIHKDDGEKTAPHVSPARFSAQTPGSTASPASPFAVYLDAERKSAFSSPPRGAGQIATLDFIDLARARARASERASDTRTRGVHANARRACRVYRADTEYRATVRVGRYLVIQMFDE